jgi:hypothetical protein
MTAKAQKKASLQAKTKQQTKVTIVNPANLPIWVSLLIFFGTTVIFFWDVILQNSFFWEDFIEYVFPTQTFAAVEFSKGTIPFWNPFSFMGMPFYADLQVGFFYPLNRLLTLFVSNNTIPVFAIELVIIIHFVIAQITAYFLAKYFKISNFGAIITAISYGFSMLIVCHVIHPMIVYHLAWLPLIFLFFIQSLEKRKLSSAILAGLIFGFVMLSGHPQLTLYIGLLLGIIFLWVVVSEIASKKLFGFDYLRVVLAGLLTVIIALGIFSIQYLPSKVLAAESQRSEITYEKSTEGSLQFSNVYTAVVPNIFGKVTGDSKTPATYYKKYDANVQTHFYWETAFYFGIVALFLGLVGAIQNYRNKTGMLLIFLALFGFLFALGRNGIVYNILYNFPFFGTFRNPTRMMFMTVLAFSLLAGFGFDSLWQKLKDKQIRWIILASAMFPLLIALLTASGFMSNVLQTPPEIKETITQYGIAAVVIVLIAYAIAFLVNWKIINPSVGGLIFFLLAFVDLYIAGHEFNLSPVNPVDVYTMKPELKTTLTPKFPGDIYRVNTRIYKPVSFMSMQRNQGMIDRILMVEGYNPLVLEKAAIYTPDVKSSFDLSNVRYQINVDLEKGSWAYIKRDSALPNAWMVYDAVVIPESQVKEYMKNTVMDYSRKVVLSEKPGIQLSGIVSDTTNSKVICTDYKPNEIIYRVETKESGILCFSEIWYPDWKIMVDDKPAKMLRAFNSFRAVVVPEGKHKITMFYESDEYGKGKIIAMIVFIASIVGFFFLLHLEKHRDDSKKDEAKKQST